MKVRIGPYKNYIGPYQIADLLKHVGVSDDKCHDIGGWMTDNIPGLMRTCEWIESKRKRNIKVNIDYYDVWSLDHTLSMVALPMLKLLKERLHGAGFTDDEDVPDHLKSTAAPAKAHEWDTDDNHFARWEYVLDEMIFAHAALADGDWEMQFHSGEVDIQWEPTDNPNLNEMVRGPKDTSKFDKEGYDAYSKRIDNGLRLFGKYYRNLWN
jgi:hypothetical protein